MPSTTTTESHSLTYPAEGATGWYSTWESLMQQITDYLDDITAIRIGTLKDTNGNEQLELTATASAVNHWKMTNAATGNSPLLEATGDDATVNVQIRHKGTSGKIILQDSSGNELLETAQTASAVNHLQITNNATANSPLLSATGSDSDVDLRLGHKGTGGRVVIEDSSGNEIVETAQTASAVNHISVTNNATGNSPVVAATGSDSNVDLRLAHKGTSGKVILEDSSGNEIVETAQTASAVNHISITNNSTGNAPVVAATGGDSNVDLRLAHKGTSGKIILEDSSGNEIVETAQTASAVNHVKVTNNATGSAPEIAAVGGDTNVDLALAAKGSANITVNTEILDSSVSAGVGWFPLSRTTASSSSPVDITIPTGYDQYKIILNDLRVSADTILRMRTSADNGSTYDSGSTDYEYTRIRHSEFSTGIELVEGTESAITLTADIIDTGLTFGVFGELTFYGLPQSDVGTMVQSELVLYTSRDSRGITQIQGVGRRNSSETTTDVRFYVDTGNISSGTFTLYGRTV